MTGTGKTVYLLGAGASAASDFRLPVMSGFFRDEDQDLLGAERFLRILYPRIKLEEINLEEVLTFLDLATEGFGAKWAHYAGFDPYMEREARNAVDYYIHQRLKIPSGAVCSNHLRLVKSLKKSDTILSLNYDLVADNAIWEVSPKTQHGELAHDSFLGRSHDLLQEMRTWGGTWPTVRPASEGLGLFLKLHGSLSWVCCQTDGCPYRHQFFPSSPYFEKKNLNLRGPCANCGNPLATVIIPPVIGKSVQRFPKMGFIWNLAHRELIEADVVVVIGCSLPASDYVFRWLLRTRRLPAFQATASCEFLR
ncbi:MAG: hypothetical protein WC969_06695 [Elusimicrobiota bacterium]|jgi:hypothetical protein